MKALLHPRTALPLLALTALFLSALSAQVTNANSSANSVLGDNPSPPPESRGGPMSKLTQAEKEQLKAAHDKAIQRDPSLKQKLDAAHQAMEGARKDLHAAMIKVDPSVEPILEKIAPPKGWGGSGAGGPPPPEGSAPPSQTNNVGNTNSVSTNSGAVNPPPHERRGLPPGFANLSSGERTQFKALYEQVMNDPTVVAARDAMKSATTPEARHAAKEAFLQAMNDAMIKAEPSIEPILKKLRQSTTPPQGGGQLPQ